MMFKLPIMSKFLVWLYSLVNICIPVVGLLEISQSPTGNDFKFASYNILPWNSVPLLTNSSSNLPVFAIDVAYPDLRYDPCNANAIGAGVQPLVDAWHAAAGGEMTSGDNKKSNNENLKSNPGKWVAMVDYRNLPLQCSNIIPLHLSYATTIAHTAQKLGASAVVVISRCAEVRGLTSANDDVSVICLIP